MMAARFVLLCLLGVSVSSVLGQELAVEPPASQKAVGSYEDLKQGRIVAAQSRKTITTVTTLVTSVATTCASKINPVACRRKRRSLFLANDRRVMRTFEQNTGGNSPASAGLDSSIDSALLNQESDVGGQSSEKAAKLAYTVWWSTTSTYTVISSANNGVTVSVSYLCSVVGATYPAACGR